MRVEAQTFSVPYSGSPAGRRLQPWNGQEGSLAQSPLRIGHVFSKDGLRFRNQCWNGSSFPSQRRSLMQTIEKDLQACAGQENRQ
jgi:hypothetical protein